jgi:uncharacterized membrane protein
VVLAAFRDDTYNVVLLIHIVSFLVAFAPAVINPLLERHFAANGGDEVLRNWAGFTRDYTRRISLGALVVLLVTGVLMILLSDDLIEFSDTWISLSFLAWFAIAGVVSAMILKGERLISEGDMKGRDLVAKGGPIATLLMVFTLYLMLFKPGA